MFKPGNKLSIGRPKGSVNRRTLEAIETAERLECDPFEVLLLFAKGDWKALGYDNECYFSENAEGATKLGYTIPPELRARCAEKAVEYLLPKRKSVEHVKENMLDGMSPEQKLEAMKQAVLMLEGQLKNEPTTSK